MAGDSAWVERLSTEGLSKEVEKDLGLGAASASGDAILIRVEKGGKRGGLVAVGSGKFGRTGGATTKGLVAGD